MSETQTEVKPRPVYKAMYSALLAWNSCDLKSKQGSSMQHYRDMADAWDSYINTLVKNYLPTGSGFDAGTKFDRETSLRRSMLVFDTSFHHMNEGGFYDGWTEHTVFVRPAFVGDIDIYKISGRDRNDIKDYISQTFHGALMEMTTLSLKEFL